MATLCRSVLQSQYQGLVIHTDTSKKSDDDGGDDEKDGHLLSGERWNLWWSGESEGYGEVWLVHSKAAGPTYKKC